MIIKKLVFINNEIFNYKNDTFALKSKLLAKDILREKKFLEKMQRLKGQAQKRMTFVEGKNRQETARLKHINNLIEKDFVFEDMNWLKEYIELKKSVKEIKSNTNMFQSNAFEDKENTNTSQDNRKLLSRNQMSRNTIGKNTFTTHSAPSELSFGKTNTDDADLDYLDYFRKKKHEAKQKSIKSTLTKSSLKSSSKSYTISQFEDVSSIKLNTNYLLKRKAEEIIESDEETKIKHENKLFSFKNLEDFVDKNTNYLSNQSNLYSSHTDSNQQCKVFPCALLKSYTSMIGPNNDLNENQLKSCGLKSVIGLNDPLARLTTSRLTRNTEETDTSKYSEEKIAENVTEDVIDLTKTIADDLVSNKSIRRPLRNINSAKDFVAKMKSLEAKVKYCQDQNKINFKKTDRNIRYGDPLPKNNIYRQLRIISQFDS